MADEVFLDAEQPYQKNENSYEQEILKQIDHCRKILSKEVTGGYWNKTQQGMKYEEDVRKTIIRSVDTLISLMGTFVAGDYGKEVDKKLDEIETFWKAIGEKEIKIAGKKYKIKDIGRIPDESPYYKLYIEFKADKYREIFAILMRCYQKKKQDIAKLSVE